MNVILLQTTTLLISILLIFSNLSLANNDKFKAKTNPPQGDECTDPLPFPGDILTGTCVNNFDFSYYTNLSNSPSLSCAGFGYAQAWFSVSMPIITATGDPIDISINTDGGYDVAIEFYTNDCSSGTGDCYTFGGGTANGLVQGEDYLITIEDVFGYGIADFCLSVSSPIIPPNDECTGAIPYPGDVLNNICVNGYGSDFSFFTDSGLSPSPTCNTGASATGWFTFTAPVTTTVGDPISLLWDAGSYCFIGIDVYETDCNTPLLSCIDNSNGTLSGLTQGSDYLLLLWDDGNGGSFCDFCITLDVPAPPGDECTDPLPFPGDILTGACLNNFDFSNYTNLSNSPSLSCAGFGYAQAWFSVTMPIITTAGDPIDISINTDGGNDVGIEFYTSDCSSGTGDCYAFGGGITGGLLQGEDYLITIEDVFGYGIGDFCLSVYSPIIPPNNECTGAIPYPGDVTNNICATGYDFTFHTDSGLSPSPTCNTGSNASGWFTFTAPVTTTAGDPISLQWDAGNCFIGIDVYESDCNTPLFSCLDNAFGTLSGLTQGSDYLLLLWDDGTGSFNCDFCLTFGNPPPPGDECIDPIPYPGDILTGTCINFNFSGYTNLSNSPSVSCAGFGMPQAWFSFTAPIITEAGDPINIAYFSEYCDAAVEFYTSDCTSSTGSCFIAGGSGIADGLIQGEDYLVTIEDINGFGICDFCMNISYPPTLPNDECSGAIPFPGDVVNNICVAGYDFNQYTDSGLSPSPTCDTGSNSSGWFTFTAPVTTAIGDPISLEWNAGEINCSLGIDVYETDCTTPLLSCLDNANGTLSGLTQGSDYLLLLWDEGTMGSFNCSFCLTLAEGVPGCTDSCADNYDPNANVNDDSCNPYDDTCNEDCILGSFGGTWDTTVCGCVNESTPVNGCTDVTASNYDPAANCDDGSCITDCEEEINGAIIVGDPDCDVSGIDITIIGPDGTSIVVTSTADGTFSVPGGPFPCGEYIAAFNDPDSLPVCYTTTGSIDPITFTVDGIGNGDDGPFFFSNPQVPTLSQWGLISLALLLMIFGALKLGDLNAVYYKRS